MDFTLNEEQRALQETARRFARDELSEVAREIETNDEPLSLDWRRRYAEMGFLGINMDAEYGGHGLGGLEAILVIEAFAEISPALAFPIFESCVGPVRAIEHFAGEALKRRVIPKVCAGETVVAVAMSEPEAGFQERMLIAANITAPATRFICVRYGNVLASRGSVIPLFHQQIRSGGPVTITTEDMTRFLMPLDKAVDTVVAAIQKAAPGETFVPRVPSARMVDVARALISGRDLELVVTGIRPGEKVHEVMVCIEEAWRTFERDDYYTIKPMLPELATANETGPPLKGEYNSSESLMSLEETRRMLEFFDLLVEQETRAEVELLR